MLPKLHRALIFKKVDMGSHIFPLYLFKCLFEEWVLKSFLYCTISSTPGGRAALLLNICKLLLLHSLHLITPFFIQHDLYFEDCISLLSPGPALHPSLLLSPLSYSAWMTLFYTLSEKGSSTELPAPRFFSPFFKLPR